MQVDFERLPGSQANRGGAVDAGPGNIVMVALITKVINADAQDGHVSRRAEFHQVESVGSHADHIEMNAVVQVDLGCREGLTGVDACGPAGAGCPGGKAAGVDQLGLHGQRLDCGPIG